MPIDLMDYQNAYTSYTKPKPVNNLGEPKPNMDMSQILASAKGVESEYPKQAWQTIKSLGLGSAQSLADALISAVNLPAHILGSNKKIPHPNLQQYSDPEMSIPFMAGELIGPGLGKFAAIQKLNKLRRPAGIMGIGSDIARGAGVGYALGETGDQGEGRISGALLQGGAAGLGSLGSKNIAKNVAKEKKKVLEYYQKGYSDLFDQANKSGIKYTGTRIASPTLSKEMRYSKDALKRYRQNPSLENAHWLQSDLGKDIRALEKQSVLSSEKIKALGLAKKAQEQIKTGIDRAFMSKMQPDLVLRYKELGKGYGKEAVPYLSPKIKEALGRFESGKANAKQTLKALKGSKVFREELKNQFPEISAQEFVKKLAKVGLYGGASALGGGYAAKKGIQYATED